MARTLYYHYSVVAINNRSKGPDFAIQSADSNFVLAFEDINSGDPGSAPSNGVFACGRNLQRKIPSS